MSGQTQTAASSPETLQLFLLVYRPGPAWIDGVPLQQQNLRPHAGYIKSLLDEKKLFAAGRFTDRDGGMAIVTAPSLEAAQALIAADPAIVSGLFEGDVMAWLPSFRAPGPLPGAQ